MFTLQELISRARFLLNDSPKRLEVFKLVNGKKSAKEISQKTKRSLSVVLQDLQKMKELGIIDFMIKEGKMIKRDNSIVYQKNPALKHLSPSLLKNPNKIPVPKNENKRKTTRSNNPAAYIPKESEILDICKGGESQTIEFKRAGVDVRTLSKEICAFANTKDGGLIFYGIEDDGTISQRDKKMAELDQSLNNSLYNTVTPALTVKIIEREVVGNRILIIAVNPWNKKDVYHYESRVYIRKGTNVFCAKQEESRSLFSGKYIV